VQGEMRGRVCKGRWWRVYEGEGWGETGRVYERKVGKGMGDM